MKMKFSLNLKIFLMKIKFYNLFFVNFKCNKIIYDILDFY